MEHVCAAILTVVGDVFGAISTWLLLHDASERILTFAAVLDQAALVAPGDTRNSWRDSSTSVTPRLLARFHCRQLCRLAERAGTFPGNLTLRRRHWHRLLSETA